MDRHHGECGDGKGCDGKGCDGRGCRERLAGGRDRSPTWLWVLAGGLVAAGVLRAAAGTPMGARPRPPLEALDLERAPARDLRRLPGIGEGRAEAIRRARWTRGGLPRLEEIDGIGPRTAELLAPWLDGSLRAQDRPTDAAGQAPEASRRAPGPPPSGE